MESPSLSGRVADASGGELVDQDPVLAGAGGDIGRPSALEDEDAAVVARARYRAGPMAAQAPDAVIAPLLHAAEQVLAVRTGALIDRRQQRTGSDGGMRGNLYVTSQRIVFVGRLTLSVGLDEIDEAVISGERLLLLVLPGGRGVSLDVDRPRVLRVEIATARTSQSP